MIKVLESTIQIHLMNYINQFYPEIFVYSIPNEAPVRGKLSTQHAIAYVRKRKSMGMKCGMPDLHILADRGEYKSYFIELKAKGKKPTPIQKGVHEELRSIGHKVDVFDDLVKAINAVDNYLKL